MTWHAYADTSPDDARYVSLRHPYLAIRSRESLRYYVAGLVESSYSHHILLSTTYAIYLLPLVESADSPAFYSAV